MPHTIEPKTCASSTDLILNVNHPLGNTDEAKHAHAKTGDLTYTITQQDSIRFEYEPFLGKHRRKQMRTCRDWRPDISIHTTRQDTMDTRHIMLQTNVHQQRHCAQKHSRCAHLDWRRGICSPHICPRSRRLPMHLSNNTMKHQTISQQIDQPASKPVKDPKSNQSASGWSKWCSSQTTSQPISWQ